jgi:hypothetical protein
MERPISTRPEPLTYAVETAATMLGISRALAYPLVRGGELPSIKLGLASSCRAPRSCGSWMVSLVRARARPTVERSVSSREIHPIR